MVSKVFVSLVLVTLLPISLAQGASRCQNPVRNNVASVTIGFEYKESQTLRNTHNDAKFFHALGKRFSPNPTMITDSHPAARDKAAFLTYLEQTIGNAQTINLNFAGHGLVSDKGEFMMVLPSVPQECIAKVAPKVYRGLTRSENAPDSCDKYIVSSNDLKKVVKDRKVFGVVDSCHAGAIELGQRSNVLFAAQPNELANDGAKGHGAFTEMLRDLLDHKSCELDFDGDQQVSLEELAAKLPPVYLDLSGAPNLQVVNPDDCDQRGLSRKECQTRGLVRKGGQILPGQNPGRKGVGDWTSCLALQSVNGTCSKFGKYDVFENIRPKATVFITKDGPIPMCLLRQNTKVQTLTQSTNQEWLYVELPSEAGCPRERGYVKKEDFRLIEKAAPTNVVSPRNDEKTL